MNQAFARGLLQWTARATDQQLITRMGEIDEELQQERPWEPIELVLIGQELNSREGRVVAELEAQENEKAWEYLLRPVTLDLDTVERLELERIHEELRNFQPQRRMPKIDDTHYIRGEGPPLRAGGGGQDISNQEWLSTVPGATVYHDILQAPDAVNLRKGDMGVGKPNYNAVADDVRDLLEGKKVTRVSGRAVVVARARADGGYPPSGVTHYGYQIHELSLIHI